MRKSIATVSLSGALEEKLDAVVAAGFEGVEIFELDLLTSSMSPEEVRSRLADGDVKLEMFQPFRDFEAVSPERFESNLRRARHKFELMHRLGTDLMLVCSNVNGDPVDDDALAAEQLHALAELAGEQGVRIAYEALAWGTHVNDYRHAAKIVRRADHPALGICLDSFHILSRGDDPAGIADIPGEQIFFLQLADAPLMSLDLLQWSRHFRCFPGQGGLDLAGMTAEVLGTGYDGPLSLEVFNDVFRQSPPDRTAVDAMRSLVALEESTLAIMGGPEPRLSAPTATHPSSGFAFVELAVEEEEALGDLLRAAGLTRVGEHRTKPVSLWQAGSARVLLNTGGDTAGPRLRAFGLESADPPASVRRAVALQAPVLPRNRAADEAVLNAVAAPDGTEIFFARTDEGPGERWTDDFRCAVDLPERSLRVDHVALSQPWQFFDEATLFYRSVLGLVPSTGTDVVDPHGLVRSQAMSSEGGAVRIALNVQPAALADLTSHPTQHVAFATDDLLRLAEHLAARGDMLLPTPANYYDDLDARYDLDAQLLDRMRQLGVLYDRAGDAEYLQLYTLTRGNLFFEFVQRINGYSGYGASNAPIRLGAQHRAAGPAHQQV